MKLLLGLVALACVLSSVSSAESPLKKRLALTPKELAESDETLTNARASESSEPSEQSGSKEGAKVGKEMLNGAALDDGVGKSTVIPLRKLRNKKGSARRNNTEERTAGEANGYKYKSNQRTNKKKLISNSKLLTRLGLTRVEPHNQNHYRKRLAGINQKNDLFGSNYKGHQKRILENVDSRMYVIKLPPSSHYYASHLEASKNRIQDSQKYNVNNLGINFNNNGKPNKVYHYNIPIMNKVVGRKTNSNSYKYDDEISEAALNEAAESNVYNIQSFDSHVNDLGMAPGHEEMLMKSSHKKPYGSKKAVTYMKPKSPAKPTFTKYFPSNGKPHSFYVIENSSGPYYHRLLP